MRATVSVIQFQPAFADPEESLKRLAPMFDEIRGTDIVVLPELSNSGYNFKSYKEAFQYAEVIGEKGVFQDFLIARAKSKNIYIISGINEREGDHLFNSAILVGGEGVIGKYRKAHLFMNEKDIYQKGNTGFPVFDLGAYKIGMMICFDYFFPEPWRMMAQKGADLICHPSNLLTMNAHRCLPGLSLMNRVFIATSNRIGTEGDITFSGMSAFTDPSGIITRMASPDKTEIITTEIDTELSGNKMITARNHVFNDRRPGMYIS